MFSSSGYIDWIEKLMFGSFCSIAQGRSIHSLDEWGGQGEPEMAQDIQVCRKSFFPLVNFHSRIWVIDFSRHSTDSQVCFIASTIFIARAKSGSMSRKWSHTTCPSLRRWETINFPLSYWNVNNHPILSLIHVCIFICAVFPSKAQVVESMGHRGNWWLQFQLSD